MLQIKVWPVALEKEDLCILMALPEHKVAETLHTAGADKDVQRRVERGVHVAVQRISRDGFGIRESCRVGRAFPCANTGLGRVGQERRG